MKKILIVLVALASFSALAEKVVPMGGVYYGRYGVESIRIECLERADNNQCIEMRMVTDNGPSLTFKAFDAKKLQQNGQAAYRKELKNFFKGNINATYMNCPAFENLGCSLLAGAFDVIKAPFLVPVFLTPFVINELGKKRFIKMMSFLLDEKNQGIYKELFNSKLESLERGIRSSIIEQQQ